MLLYSCFYLQVDAEYAKNKAIGEAIGCWKGGVLVEDDAGSVRKYFEAQQQLQQQGGAGAGDGGEAMEEGQ